MKAAIKNKIKFGRFLGAGAFVILAGLGLASCSNGGGGNTSYELKTDIPLGSNTAKVVMVEYASITCPHCAAFQADVMPEIKSKYIDTGKVRYVFREFPTPPIDIAMAGHLLSRCVAPAKHEAVINALMGQQVEIVTQAQGPNGAKQALMNVAASVGMSSTDFDNCMKNKEKLRELADILKHGQDVDKITGTPTIIINGKTFTPPIGQEYTPKMIGDALDAELAKTGAAPAK